MIVQLSKSVITEPDRFKASDFDWFKSSTWIQSNAVFGLLFPSNLFNRSLKTAYRIAPV